MKMATKLLTAGTFAAAMSAGAVQAASITIDGVSAPQASCNVTGGAANSWATIDVLSGALVNAVFENADGKGNLCFNLVNSSLTTAAVTLAVATVNQGILEVGESIFSWAFDNGVSLVSEQLGGELWYVEEGKSANQNFTFLMAAGSTVFFDWEYGDPYTNAGKNKPQIDFQVFAAPVPLPAAGFLLIGALGGLAALRRRKAA